MTEHLVDYELLLTEDFRNNPFWTDLTTSMSSVFNPVIHNPIEALEAIRSITVEPYFAGLNMQMVGFRVPILSFTPAEYQRLMKYIGTFIQTRGASISFVNFIGFIKNAKFDIIPLWADNITDINSLSDTFGTEIWNGGSWFPTPFIDVTYDLSVFTLDESQIELLLRVLAPIHLVIRQLVGVFSSSTALLMTPYSYEITHDFGAASR